MSCKHRIGFGNDIHQLTSGRKLVLGGVEIPFERGPIGHSDGDALAHAICDVLLGAAGLGDIGRHFPDTSPEWRGVSSLLFLRQVRRLLEENGYIVINIDSTVDLERPKLAPHIARIQAEVAAALGVSQEQVNVKAKTSEGLEAVGRGEAVRAEAVALLELCKA